MVKNIKEGCYADVSMNAYVVFSMIKNIKNLKITMKNA